MGPVRQSPLRLEPQQDRQPPGRTGRLATQRRLERSLPLLVAVVEVVAGQARPTLTVDPVAGLGGRGECLLALRRLQAGYRADRLRLVDSVEAARIRRTVRGIRQIPAVRQVATPCQLRQAAWAMALFLAVPVAVRADRQHRQTRTQSDGQAEPRGRHYHRQVGVVEQPERQPVRTEEQARHPQAEPDRAAVVARVTRQAQAAQAVTAESALAVGVAAVELLVVPVVEVVEVKQS